MVPSTVIGIEYVPCAQKAIAGGGLLRDQFRDGRRLCQDRIHSLPELDDRVAVSLAPGVLKKLDLYDLPLFAEASINISCGRSRWKTVNPNSELLPTSPGGSIVTAGAFRRVWLGIERSRGRSLVVAATRSERHGRASSVAASRR